MSGKTDGLVPAPSRNAIRTSTSAMSIMLFAASSFLQPNGFANELAVDDFVLTPAERALFDIPDCMELDARPTVMSYVDV